MAWLLIAGLGLIVVLRFSRRRRVLFAISPSEPISTIHLEQSKRQTAKTRAALAAATAALR